VFKALGIILICYTPAVDSCQVLRSPVVFDSEEACQADTYNHALYLHKATRPAYLAPQCIVLTPEGEAT
jgi:hypothetical protein